MTISFEFEPAELLAAIEHHLQCADAERQAQEAEPGKGHVAAGRRLRHEDGEPHGRQNAERQIDEEHPPPRIGVGQPAAERRPHDRAEHHSHAPDRHRRAASRRRKDVEHHRLAQRHQRRAEHALQQAVGDHLFDRERDAAQHRRDGEARGADDEQLLSPEARRHPAERRGHDRGGDDVGGQHPVDLVLRRRQGALHIGQGDIGDGRVERLHHRRHHDADSQHPSHRRRDGLVERLVHFVRAALAAPRRCTRSRPKSTRSETTPCSVRTRPVSIDT